MKQLCCQGVTGVPEASRVKLTLLVCSHAGLRVLHVHHDAALPVSLRVNGHLITCKTRCFLFRPACLADARGGYVVSLCLPDGVLGSCEASAGKHVSLLLFLLPLALEGTVAKSPEDRANPGIRAFPVLSGSTLERLRVGFHRLLTEASVAGELLVDLLHPLDVEAAGLGVVHHGFGVVDTDHAFGRLLHALGSVPGVVNVFGWETPQDGQVTPGRGGAQ